MRSIFTTFVLILGTFLLGACGSKSLGVGASARVATDAAAAATPTPVPTDITTQSGSPTPTPTPSASPSPTPDYCMGYAGTYTGGTCVFGDQPQTFTLSFVVKVQGTTCVATAISGHGDYKDTVIDMTTTPIQATGIDNVTNAAEKNGKLTLPGVGKFKFVINNTAGGLKVCQKL